MYIALCFHACFLVCMSVTFSSSGCSHRLVCIIHFVFSLSLLETSKSLQFDILYKIHTFVLTFEKLNGLTTEKQITNTSLKRKK